MLYLTPPIVSLQLVHFFSHVLNFLIFQADIKKTDMEESEDEVTREMREELRERRHSSDDNSDTEDREFARDTSTRSRRENVDRSDKVIYRLAFFPLFIREKGTVTKYFLMSIPPRWSPSHCGLFLELYIIQRNPKKNEKVINRLTKRPKRIAVKNGKFYQAHLRRSISLYNSGFFWVFLKKSAGIRIYGLLFDSGSG